MANLTYTYPNTTTSAKEFVDTVRFFRKPPPPPSRPLPFLSSAPPVSSHWLILESSR